MKTSFFSKVQKLGKSLMLPIAILPAAGLLLRFGQPDLLNIPFIAQAGGAVFANLALIFAIGVAIGFAKDNHGAAALSGAVGYLIIDAATKTINPDINMGVLSGIIAGIVAGVLYNKYKSVKLPAWLGFFGGRRFVPIVTAATCIVLALLFGFIWPPIQSGLDAFGNAIINLGALGAGLFGFFNRLLIPFGLHHVLNSFFWFEFGEFTNAAGEVVVGDLTRFFAGDPSAGVFMAGFFPIMMFALPAAALAMYSTAKKQNKPVVGGMLISVALTSLLTGITEPIEFMFMFLAPVLYVIHAVFTGLAMAVAYVLNVLCGFTFSAGAIDYLLNFNISTNAWLVIPLGLVFGVLYYVTFVVVIKKFNLPTPGREDDEAGNLNEILKMKSLADVAKDFYQALGGSENIQDVDSCITRLRLVIADGSKVSDETLKQLGASGVIRPTSKNMQIVVGTLAEQLADEMKALL
ncbi:N-acetylglucosamine-specific PTS transporter subunit IIBC [Vallitalea okinawensis]|uniref:N-acetylglucosamine-specific PTS transporter subunit IIBC n=1 Tax=Vallitalea okinawensis TaxID=2078660 RepID=UPI000CFC53C1|nr:N-acetylglucosamine-specific PTS transporter subunit IIBC [Vallitalea okinawensis]